VEGWREATGWLLELSAAFGQFNKNAAICSIFYVLILLRE
jgi:hypothetical protein